MKIDIKKIRQYVLAHKFISTIGAIVIIFGSTFIYKKIHPTVVASQYVLGKVSRGDLVQSVSGTGQVATLSAVDIKAQTVGQAQTLGQITSVNVQNGDFVKTGQIIAVLDGKNALQSLNQAKASVAIAQANYNKLVNGPTAIDLESINNSIESSQNTLENTKQDILIKLRSAYVSASTAVYINTDSFFVGPNSLIPALSITNVNLLNQDLQSKVEMGRANVGTILQSFKDGIAGESSSSDLVSDLNKYISDLNQFSTYFSNMTDLFSNYTFAGNSTAQSLINTDKSAANSAQSSVNSAISDLTSALQSYKSEILSLQQSENNLGLKTATPSGDDLTVSKSSLDNAEANYQNALSNYESRIIRAPFDGQIGGLNAQIGQQVASNDSLGKIITQDRVVNILLNEVDATKVGANNPVILTFDALPGISVNGHIKYVDPLGVVTQGVVNYSVRVSIDDKNDSIKTGMTASAEITTITHQNVLMVPNSAIITKNGRKFVSVLAAS